MKEEPPINPKIRKIRSTGVAAMPASDSTEYMERKNHGKEVMRAKSAEAVSQESVDDIFNQAFRLGDNIEAIEIYKKIVELYPGSADAFINMGTIYYQTGDLEEAEKCYKRALEIHPEYPLANFDMGALKEDQGQKEEAITYYLKAIESNPVYTDPYHNLGALYQGLGEYSKAIEQYERYLDLTINNPTHLRIVIEVAKEFCQKKLAEKNTKK